MDAPGLTTRNESGGILDVDTEAPGDNRPASLSVNAEANANPMIPTGVNSTPTKASRARKVLRVFLFPFQVIATPIAMAVCAIVYASAGLGIGFTLGAIMVIKLAYTENGLILAIAASVLSLPLGVYFGAGLSVVGLFKGIMDGALMPWDRGKSFILTTRAAEHHIDTLLQINRSHPSKNA